MLLRRGALALVASLLMGCDRSESGDPLSPEIGELSQRHACADLILVAADAEASEGLFLTIDDGLVDQVTDSGQPVQMRYDVGDERIELRWVSGSNVYAGHCGLDNGEPWQVDMVEQAISGEIIVELEPAAEGPILAVELRDVLLSPLGEGFAKAEAHELPELRLDDLRVDQ
jgi:hypothetical protein